MESSRLRYSKSAYVAECSFETARSGGKGGQHVNKTESKVTLVFDLSASQLFDGTEKKLLEDKLKSHLHNCVLRISGERSRSQMQNKKYVITHFLELLENGLKVKAKRIPTKISKAKKESRLKSKRIESEKKAGRRWKSEQG